MVLAKQHQRLIAVVVILALFFVLYAESLSIGTLRKLLTEAWKWLRQILSAIGLIERTIDGLKQDNAKLQKDIDKLNGSKASYNRYIPPLQRNFNQFLSDMRQKESELQTAQNEGDTTRVNRLTGEIRRLQRRIDALRYRLDSIDSSIKSINRQIKSKRDKIKSNNQKIQREENAKQRRENEADQAEDRINDLQRQIREAGGGG